MNFYLEHNYSGEANARMSPMETFEAEYCVQGYNTYSAVLVATVGEQLQCAQECRNTKDSFAVAVLNRGDIVGHIPKKISRNDRETSRTLLYNDRLLQMTLGLFYVFPQTQKFSRIGPDSRKMRKFAPRKINRLYGTFRCSQAIIILTAVQFITAIRAVSVPITTPGG